RRRDRRAVLPRHRHREPARHLRRDRPQREDAFRSPAVPRLPRAVPVARVARAGARPDRDRARRDGLAEAAMIEWRAPVALWALALAPALVAFFVWAERRRAQALAAFVAATLVPAVVPDAAPRRRQVRAGLVVAAVLLAALALGGPLWGFHWQEVKRQGI